MAQQAADVEAQGYPQPFLDLLFLMDTAACMAALIGRAGNAASGGDDAGPLAALASYREVAPGDAARVSRLSAHVPHSAPAQVCQLHTAPCVTSALCRSCLPVQVTVYKFGCLSPGAFWHAVFTVPTLTVSNP